MIHQDPHHVHRLQQVVHQQHYQEVVILYKVVMP